MLDTQRKKSGFIHHIMIGDFLVAKWCPKSMNVRCLECLLAIKLLLICSIRYGKRYRNLIIANHSSPSIIANDLVIIFIVCFVRIYHLFLLSNQHNEISLLNNTKVKRLSYGIKISKFLELVGVQKIS